MLKTRHLGISFILLTLMAQISTAAPALGEMKLFALDIETTGLSPSNDRIVEISIIEFTGTNIGQRSSWLVNPKCSIPAASTKVHGITNEMVKDSPVFADIAGKIQEMISDSTIVAHNARFDWQFIMSEYMRARIDPPQVKVIDSIPLAKAVFPNLKSYALQRLCKDLKINAAPTHRSESDTEALVLLIQKCVSVIGAEEPSSRLDAFALNKSAEPKNGK